MDPPIQNVAGSNRKPDPGNKKTVINEVQRLQIKEETSAVFGKTRKQGTTACRRSASLNPSPLLQLQPSPSPSFARTISFRYRTYFLVDEQKYRTGFCLTIPNTCSVSSMNSTSLFYRACSSIFPHWKPSLIHSFIPFRLLPLWFSLFGILLSYILRSISFFGFCPSLFFNIGRFLQCLLICNYFWLVWQHCGYRAVFILVCW